MEDNKIGNCIRSARKEKGWTQFDLAAQIGINRVTVSKYESGEIIPPIPKIQAIADALGCAPGYLLGTQERLMDESAARALERMYGVADGTLREYTKDHTAMEAAEIKLQQLKMEKYEIQFKEFMAQLNDAGKDEAIRRIRELSFVPEFRSKEGD